MNFKSVGDMDRAIARNLWKLDRTKFDLVVGIPRSGMLPASIISTYLQLPLATLEGYIAGIVHGRSGHVVAGSDRILLVDDTSNKGGAMRRAMQVLQQGGKGGAQVTRMAVYGPYQVEDPSKQIDIWLEDCKGPRGFAWNLWKHARLKLWGFDLDGVFCRDPSKAENDDGDRYRDFCLSVEPLFLPNRPIGHIITSRLERFRPETEAWLEHHGIQYAQLHMMNLPTKAARLAYCKQREGGRGAWKADLCREVGVGMYIESSRSQAKVIAREADIPVWCTEVMQLFDPGGELHAS